MNYMYVYNKYICMYIYHIDSAYMPQTDMLTIFSINPEFLYYKIKS